MTRSIPPSLAGVVQHLEKRQPRLVTTAMLSGILADLDMTTDVYVVAQRLREKGWLLPTDRRGVWDFAPAAAGGPYSRREVGAPLRAFLADYPEARAALTFHAAAWHHDVADRAPRTIEVAAATREVARRLPGTVKVTFFDPRLPYDEIAGVPVLAVESVLVHMATKPSEVRSWASAEEWLPDLAAKATWQKLAIELDGRESAVRARTGYLLSGMRPDLAEYIRQTTTLRGKTWFGPRPHRLRYDKAWVVADTLLPFDPRQMRPVA